MTQSEMILYVIKLVMGGLSALFAILLWSKTKDFAWMSLVIGVVFSYLGLLFNMFVDAGILVTLGPLIPGTELPLLTVVLIVIPNIFFILAFVLMLHRSSK